MSWLRRRTDATATLSEADQWLIWELQRAALVAALTKAATNLTIAKGQHVSAGRADSLRRAHLGAYLGHTYPVASVEQAEAEAAGAEYRQARRRLALHERRGRRFRRSEDVPRF